MSGENDMDTIFVRWKKKKKKEVVWFQFTVAAFFSL